MQNVKVSAYTFTAVAYTEIIASNSWGYMSFKPLKRLFQKRTATIAAAAAQTHTPKKTQKRPLLFSIGIALFTLFLAAAPHSAEAARPLDSNGNPTGPGMFDCLGDLDWGCRILSFLFDENTVPGGNHVTYVKYDPATGKATPVEEEPGIVHGALRAMMAFFSNAILVIASLKLLYELLQMTAETAHSGQIGGRETNQLWTPIRLVVAIGLLVPLSSGMNSGQHIILQIAKWGSGMASQAWVVFTDALIRNEKLTEPSPARIYKLAMNTFKTYVCVEIADYFASETGLPGDSIRGEYNRFRVGQSEQIKLGTASHDDVCGSFTFRLPAENVSANPFREEDARISYELTKINEEAFLDAKERINSAAIQTSKLFLPGGDINFLKDASIITIPIRNYQEDIANRLRTANVGQKAFDAIVEKIRTVSRERGWTSAGSLFLAIARAQGQIITGGMNIPEASGPDMFVLDKFYPDVAPRYRLFLSWLEESAQNHSNLGSPSQLTVIPRGPQPGEIRTVDDTLEESYLWKAITNFGEWTIDKLLWAMDKLAVYTGLWSYDPARAFGDLGATTNPFGEISALGHKKIRLGLNYLGLSFWLSGLSGAADGGSKLISESATPAVLGFKAFLAVAGKTLSVINAIVVMIATLFLLAGIMLGYIVPLFPFVRFFFAILTWLGTLMEGMICLPFLALAHLTPKGEGFTGQNARGGYYLIFQIFLRPVLTVFGLIAAMLMFYVAAKFLNSMFYEATSGIEVYDGAAMKFIQKLVYSLIYVGLIYISANLAFKMIDQIPKHALKWMGQQVSEEPYDDHNNFLQIAGAIGGQQLISNFTSLPKDMGGLIGTPISATGDRAVERRTYQALERRHMQHLQTLRDTMGGGGRDGGGGGGGGGYQRGPSIYDGSRPRGGGGGERQGRQGNLGRGSRDSGGRPIGRASYPGAPVGSDDGGRPTATFISNQALLPEDMMNRINQGTGRSALGDGTASARRALGDGTSSTNEAAGHAASALGSSKISQRAATEAAALQQQMLNQPRGKVEKI